MKKEYIGYLLIAFGAFLIVIFSWGPSEINNPAMSSSPSALSKEEAPQSFISDSKEERPQSPVSWSSSTPINDTPKLPVGQMGTTVTLENNCVLTLGMKEEEAHKNMSTAGYIFNGRGTIGLSELQQAAVIDDVTTYRWGANTRCNLIFSSTNDTSILCGIEIEHSSTIKTEKGLIPDPMKNIPADTVEALYGLCDDKRIYEGEGMLFRIYKENDLILTIGELAYEDDTITSILFWRIELSEYYIVPLESRYDGQPGGQKE